jgi:type I restriction-modification system
MDTKKLRQKILDLAIHGKLVPQDPNDEPASVLLERIKAEKERLIKEGKIKGSKKSAKTSDTPHYENVPFEIPSSWVWTTGNEIFSPLRSCIPQGDTFIYVDIDAIDNKVNIINNPKIMRTADAPSRATRYTKAGDVLFSMVRPYLRNIAIVPENGWIASTGFYVCSPSKLLLSQYCYYLMLSDYVVDGLNQYMKGDNSPSINNSHILSWLYPIPPLTEQQRIVKEIERWFASIDEIEQDKSDLQTIIKQAKSKILDLAIHGKLVPQNPNDEPASELLKRINPKAEITCDNGHSEKLPQGWYSATINDVCSIIGGVSYNKADIQDTGIRVLRGGNIQSGKVFYCSDDVFIPFSYQNKENQVQYGDIIVVASTGSQTLIGKTGFVDRDIPKTQIGAFLRIVRPKQKTLSPYIRLLFQTDAYKDYIRNVAKGSNINNVKNAHLQNYQICLPPLAEQQRIVTKIEELFSVLDNIQNALEA